MEIKIIGKSVVPDKITLYENDLGAKHLVFSSNRINDGVNLDKLSAYLEIEREEGVSDRFILDKTVNGDTLYFTLPINLALTETADLISSQLVFENDEKTLSYRTKVFYVDVKNSVDGVSSYEQVAPTVLSQLESKMENAVENCESIKNEVVTMKAEFENNIEETSSKIKDEVISQVNGGIVDDALSTESTNPVQNKVIAEALNNKVNKTTYPTDLQAGVCRASVSNYSETGVSANQNTGLLYLSLVTDKQLTEQTNSYVAVSPIKLARAVKQGLINPDIGAYPANWTEEEKALARQTIGATKLYKHIIYGRLTDYNNTIFDFELIFYSYRKDIIGYDFIRPYNEGPNYIYLEPYDVVSIAYAKTSNANGDSITCPIELDIWQLEDASGYLKKFAYRIDTQVNDIVVENTIGEAVYEV